MNTPLQHHCRARRGSVLIIVMVVCLGLVSLTLLLGHNMVMAYRGADNRLAGHQADQTIEGAVRYAEYLIANVDQPGTMPDPTTYQSEAVPIDDGTFWYIGEPGPTDPVDTPAFSLVDEASKLNLNAPNLSGTMLMQLPNMTQELATAILRWRSSGASSINSTSSITTSSTGSTSPIKYAPFESMEELALVTGTDPTVLYGEDTNLNHVQDPNETDDSQSSSSSNATGSANGQVNFGLLEYVTVFSREPNVLSDGSTPRINIATLSSTNRIALTTALTTALGDSSRAEQIVETVLPRGGGRPPRRGRPGTQERSTERHIDSVLGFYVACPDLTDDEFDKIAPYLTATTGHFVYGLINVNTASATVLACVPGLSDKASDLVSARMNRAQPSTGFAWVKSVLGNEAAEKAGPYLTWRTYQITADVAAVGRYGRGYRRAQVIIDSSLGFPRIVYRRNLAGLGWALGSDAQNALGIQKNTQ